MPLINKIRSTILSIFFFSFPFFILNLTPEPSETSKLMLLIFTTIVLLINSALSLFFTKKIHFSFSLSDIPIILITLMYIISTFFSSSSKFLPLISTLSLSTWIFLIIFYFSMKAEDQLDLLGYIKLTTLGTGIIAIYVLFMYSGFLPQNINTPSGNLLQTAILFLVCLVFQTFSIILNLTTNMSNFQIFLKKNFLELISLIIVFIALIVASHHLFTNQKPILLPNSIAFQIIQQSFKNPHNLLIGIGPANFISAFTQYKPLSINQSSLWNITFTSSSSFFTTLTTETGIISALSFIAFILIAIIALIKSVLENNSSLFTGSLAFAVLTILLLFFPGSTALLLVQVSLLAVLANSDVKQFNLKKLKYLAFLFPISSLVIASVIAYTSIRAFLGEYYFQNAVLSLSESNLSQAYNYQKQAINQNPYLDKYHLAISKSSLLIADSLLNKENKSKEEVQQIPQLISQAISEAKFAISLNKSNVLNWANLSAIYSSLITFAPGAQNWAIDISKQTILLDPKNPNHYLQLAQIYTKTKKTTQAEESLKKALSLKPDLKIPESIQPRQE